MDRVGGFVSPVPTADEPANPPMAAIGASGTHFRTAPVLVSASFAHPDVDAGARAVLSIPEDKLAAALGDLHARPAELVVISTCLRHELYAVGIDHERLRAIAGEMAGGVADLDLLPDPVELYGRESVIHLFRVAAGLQSPVVGEHEVLGQVRRAHTAAQRAGTLGPVLDQIFREAIRTGREVRDMLPAPDHGSVAAIAADHVLDTEPGRLVLVGAGQMANAVADHLDGSSWEVVRVTRRPDRVNGAALGLDALADELVGADVCVTAVTSPREILSRGDLAAVVARRGGRTLRVVDVGMPANVDGAGVDGIDYEGIDRLAADHRHRIAVDEAASVVEIRSAETHARVVNSALTPLIRRLREKADHAVEEELARAFRRLDLDADERAAVEQMARTLANRLMHDPLLYLSSHPQAIATSDTARNILGIPEH